MRSLPLFSKRSSTLTILASSVLVFALLIAVILTQTKNSKEDIVRRTVQLWEGDLASTRQYQG